MMTAFWVEGSYYYQANRRTVYRFVFDGMVLFNGSFNVGFRRSNINLEYIFLYLAGVFTSSVGDSHFVPGP